MAAKRDFANVQVSGLSSAQVTAMQDEFESQVYPGLTATFSGGSSGTFPNFDGGGDNWIVSVNQSAVDGTDAQGLQNVLNAAGLALNPPN